LLAPLKREQARGLRPNELRRQSWKSYHGHPRIGSSRRRIG